VALGICGRHIRCLCTPRVFSLVGPEVVALFIVAALEPAAFQNTQLQNAVADKWRISQLADEFARRHTTEEQRRYIGNAALVTRIIVERKLVYNVTF